MRLKAALFARTLLAVACALVCLRADAQLRIVIPQEEPAVSSTANALDDVLQRGQKFETERRWGDALTLYEEALRRRPGDPAIGPRHELAKIHYDLGRRYGDTSFRRSLASLKERDALGLYGELLLKIQSHYVTQPNWQELVRRGSSSLIVAISEDSFAKTNRIAARETQVASFRSQLERFLQTRPIRDRQAALDAVTYVSRLAQQQLQLSSTAAVLEYVSGAAGALDEYSSYLTSDQLNDVYSQIEGNFVGLGLELKAGEGGLLIVKVITGSPAERNGMQAGDVITAVDGRSVAQFSTDEAADLLQGPENSEVSISIAAADGTRVVRLRREQVEVPSVDDIKMVDREYGIGYLRLTCFQKTTSRDLDAALWKLNREGMKSLIIDVRGNPGGLLTSSVEIADKFLEDGTIVSTRGRSSLENYTYTAHKAGTWRVPLVVLIDGDSASASEIFAGAIHDHRRGTVVGERSYGKGSVQGIFPLSLGGSGVRLTTAKFYSPSGGPISNVGVRPDIEAHQVAKPLADGTVLPSTEDPVILAGIEAARQKVAQR
jgi:carboxyl-terminal processing protease